MTSLPPSSPLLGVECVDSIVTLELKRPQRRNALNQQLVQDLAKALDAAGHQEDVRALVLTGQGGAFCSGADLATIGDDAPDVIFARIDEFHALIRGIVGARQPVIAAIEGPAVGFGADLALSCDLRVMSQSAFLQESFVQVGLMPDGGGTYWARKFLGARAFEALALGEKIKASTCETLGLTSLVTADGDATDAATQLARRLAQTAPLALTQIKAALRAEILPELDRALNREKKGQTELLGSRDFKEGVRAFLEKRTPHFEGR